MSFELDHVFVAAAVGAPEIGALEEAGFVPSPAHDHPGQGTASRGVFFENAYLELLWLTDREAARSPLIARTGLAKRADPTGGACPFGFGLRSPDDPVPAPPFPSWSYAPPYLPDGMAFGMGSNSERLEEPLLFVLPFSRTASWEAPEHANGARRVTDVTLIREPSQPSSALAAFLALELVGCEHGPSHLLRVVLDAGARGAVLDGRPSLPLRLEW